MGMFGTLTKAFKVPDVRKKLIFTLLMLIVFRLGSNIPVPMIDREVLSQAFNGQGLFELFNLFSGGAFQNFTIFALSITPYITASIIINLLTVAIPYLENLAREGVEGRKKMTQITRYLTVVLALVQAIGFSVGLFRNALKSFDFPSVSIVVITLTAGTAFLMWLGEQINEHGVGNGISLIIFAGIITGAPSAVMSALTSWRAGTVSIVSLLVFVAFALIVVVGIIIIQQGQRKIPVQYAKRVVGRKMYGGQSTHIPVKVNQAGVIPVIFGMSILQFPLTITYFLPSDSGFTTFMNHWFSPTASPGVWIYCVFYAVLIFFFTYFYTGITFNPVEVAENMRANGGFIPGIRPGKPTVEYLSAVMNRVTFVGGVFLAVIAVLPYMIQNFTSLEIRFGGTSLLIVVGVALDTMKQIENQMLMRNYRGFL